MRFAARPLRAALLAGAVALAAASAGAEPELDQSQETSDNGFAASVNGSLWQTFTPGFSGRLTSVELLANEWMCMMISPCTDNDLQIEIVTTAGGVPTATVLASGTLPGANVSVQAWHGIALAPAPDVVAGTAYAIHVRSNAPGDIMFQNRISVAFAGSANPYASGALFVDTNPGDGLDDPNPADYPDGDLTFRTYVDDVICGDGIQAAEEACEDGNTVAGDGCNAECEIEACGNDVLDAGETCDDFNTVAGDGCDAECDLEPAVASCQAAIAKAGLRLVSGTLAAIQKCRTALAQGKILSVSDPALCATETAAAKTIAKARAQARKYIAGGKKPKCTNATVALLDACGETVDELIGIDAQTGCLLTEHDAAVATALDAEYGY
jgi:cysteine-rich repeat protein